MLIVSNELNKASAMLMGSNGTVFFSWRDCKAKLQRSGIHAKLKVSATSCRDDNTVTSDQKHHSDLFQRQRPLCLQFHQSKSLRKARDLSWVVGHMWNGRCLRRGPAWARGPLSTPPAPAPRCPPPSPLPPSRPWPPAHHLIGLKEARELLKGDLLFLGRHRKRMDGF